jgi:hypothetical protein
MYRSLLGVYVIPAGLRAYEQMSRSNVLAITLGPHASNMEDVVAALSGLGQIDRGMHSFMARRPEPIINLPPLYQQTHIFMLSEQEAAAFNTSFLRYKVAVTIAANDRTQEGRDAPFESLTQAL